MKPHIMKCPKCNAKLGLVDDAKECSICGTLVFRD